jgi:hypothetical protein
MASLRSANTTTSITSQSGTFKVPKVLPYPKYYDHTELKRLEHIYCYVQKHPGDVDLTVLIYRDTQKDDVYTVFSDAAGNLIELESDVTPLGITSRKFVKDELVNYVRLMNVIKIEQAQYHFSIAGDILTLVDVRTSLNKCVSPGLIEDVFGKLVNTLKTKNTVILNPSVIDAIIQGQGSYEGNLLIRPSRFRLNDDDPINFAPLYVEIRR